MTELLGEWLFHLSTKHNAQCNWQWRLYPVWKLCLLLLWNTSPYVHLKYADFDGALLPNCIHLAHQSWRGGHVVCPNYQGSTSGGTWQKGLLCGSSLPLEYHLPWDKFGPHLVAFPQDFETMILSAGLGPPFRANEIACLILFLWVGVLKLWIFNCEFLRLHKTQSHCAWVGRLYQSV